MWEVPEAGLRLFLGPAHPQDASGSPPRRPPEFQMASPAVAEAIVAMGVLPRPPQKEWQGSCHQFPGLKRPFGLPVFTMLQQTGDLPLPQVPQEGLGREEKEGE